MPQPSQAGAAPGLCSRSRAIAAIATLPWARETPPSFPTAPRMPAVPGGKTPQQGDRCAAEVPQLKASASCAVACRLPKTAPSRWEATPFGPINSSRKHRATPTAQHCSARAAPGQPQQSHILGLCSPVLPMASGAMSRTSAGLWQPHPPPGGQCPLGG